MKLPLIYLNENNDLDSILITVGKKNRDITYPMYLPKTSTMPLIPNINNYKFTNINAQLTCLFLTRKDNYSDFFYVYVDNRLRSPLDPQMLTFSIESVMKLSAVIDHINRDYIYGEDEWDLEDQEILEEFENKVDIEPECICDSKDLLNYGCRCGYAKYMKKKRLKMEKENETK
jgi:hypothetical protein